MAASVVWFASTLFFLTLLLNKHHYHAKWRANTTHHFGGKDSRSDNYRATGYESRLVPYFDLLRLRLSTPKVS